MRRLALMLLGIACLVGSEVALPLSDLAPGTATAVADSGGTGTYDRSVHAADCALLGRDFTGGLGCARARCVEGAVPWRRFAGAETCARVGQPVGYGYAATVPARECAALHRRWIASVNYCASQPDRSLAVDPDAPQCVRPASVYVTLSETEGAYDECLTPARAAELTRLAADEGRTLAAVLARRQVAAESSSPGGVLVVGDSLTWRGADELARLRPLLTIDGEPGRRPSELADRLSDFRALHGEPTGLVVELGTNTAPGYERADLTAVVRSLAASTPVLLVLPYVDTGDSRPGRFAGWMRSVAAGRPHTCLADWPAYVRAHPGLLQDGIHVRNAAERDWARWLSGQWAACVESVE